MAWTIRYAASAVQNISRLDPQVRRKVRAAIEVLSQEPERGKPLQLSLRGLRAWRTGDYRIVYKIIQERIEIIVIALGHRRDVYERLRRKLK